MNEPETPSTRPDQLISTSRTPGEPQAAPPRRPARVYTSSAGGDRDGAVASVLELPPAHPSTVGRSLAGADSHHGLLVRRHHRRARRAVAIKGAYSGAVVKKYRPAGRSASRRQGRLDLKHGENPPYLRGGDRRVRQVLGYQPMRPSIVGWAACRSPQPNLRPVGGWSARAGLVFQPGLPLPVRPGPATAPGLDLES